MQNGALVARRGRWSRNGRMPGHVPARQGRITWRAHWSKIPPAWGLHRGRQRGAGGSKIWLRAAGSLATYIEAADSARDEHGGEPGAVRFNDRIFGDARGTAR